MVEQLSSQSQPVSHRETKEIVTPYAFKVADELLGTALGSPTRRGIALLIDLLSIAVLTQVNTWILATLVTWMFWNAGRHLNQRPKRRFSQMVLRGSAAFMLFVLAFGLFEVFKSDSEDLDGIPKGVIAASGSDGIELMAVTAKHLTSIGSLSRQIETGQCQPAYDCWAPAGEALVDDLAKLDINKGQAKDVLGEFLDATDTTLNGSERRSLRALLKQRYEAMRVVTPTDQAQPVLQAGIPLTADEEPTPVDTKPPQSERQEAGEAADELSPDNYSILAWAGSLADDLGIGFGWAAFYFSVFTAWWHGQTPGKKLLGLKVIRLDGRTLNLWESFGRYGGYGAGLATGLLGFLQIYWDPNRQAIQDKISETLVIYLRKPRVQLSVQEVAELTEQSEG
ncbi:RDD family protein [Bowmanella dokdonensis]|uniref:RDD family protein n=1 Tax=Bowmanella dokdonensis TaxID=751969 RepID=A0A939DN57_9ALTE|nr:RDD family protein [Bowmanella dokdonensis]MBN7825190.1 RDD family protein [Bowmanella dokdonensis]